MKHDTRTLPIEIAGRAQLLLEQDVELARLEAALAAPCPRRLAQALAGARFARLLLVFRL